MRRTGARSPGRTRGRGREPAGAEDGEFVFVSTAPHLVRVKMNIHEAVLMRRIGARSPGRTRGRGREPAGAEDGEFVFVSTAPHLVRVRRRVRPRDRKKLGFWGKMNIHEARKLGTLSLAEREVEAASWRVQRTENSFLYNVRRVWFASGVGFDHGIEKTGFLVQNEYS